MQKLKEVVVDLEDLREGVSITDLGLNDFRVDLTNLVKIYKDANNIPDGLHAIWERKELWIAFYPGGTANTQHN